MESFEAMLVRLILADLTDRVGLRQAWESIDGDIQQEIQETWRGIIKECLDVYLEDNYKIKR